MTTTDILLCVDSDAILGAHPRGGTLMKPLALGPGYVFFVQSGVSGGATPAIVGRFGDTVRWREASLSFAGTSASAL